MSNTITIDDLLDLERWIEAAVTDDEREVRIERVRGSLFPPDLEAGEKQLRLMLLERAKKESAQRQATATTPVVALPTAMKTPRTRWQGLIPPDRSAHRRAQIHDGIFDEVAKDRARARGSPFEADEE